MMRFPFTEHTFQTVNDFWFDTPRNPPLIMLKDELSANPYLFTGQINLHRDFLALSVVQRGQGTHIVNGESYALARGDVYLMGLGSMHQYLNCGNVEIDALYFLPTIFTEEVFRVFQRQPTLSPFLSGEGIPDGSGKPIGGRWKHLTPVPFAEMNAELSLLKREWASGTELGKIATTATLVRLIVQLARQEDAFVPQGTARSAVNIDAKEAVNRAVHLIEAGFTEPLQIERIAAAVAMSPDWLTRVFHAVIGQTPRDYLRHLRLERAKALLMTTRHSITDVAQMSGFGNSAYFARVFRQQTGMTPGNFQRRHRRQE